MEQKLINGRNYFIWDQIDEKGLDQTAIRMLEQNEPEGLLPFRYVRQDEEKSFRYSCQQGLLLKDWLDQTQRRQDVKNLLLGLTQIEEELEEYLLDPAGLDTDVDHVLVRNNKCRFAYIPMRNYHGGSLLNLAKQILEDVRYALDEEYTYIFDLYNALGRREIQNMTDLKKWLRNLPDGEKEQQAEIPAELEEIPIIAAEQTEKEKSKRGGLFGKKEKKAPVKQEIPPQIIPEIPEMPKKANWEFNQTEDRTVLYYEKEIPCLRRLSTDEVFEIPQGKSVIGTGDRADIRIMGVRTISRRHASIDREDKDVWIEDMGSSNGSMLNGGLLEQMKRYPLKDGDRIFLADEEFLLETKKES